MSFAEGRRVHVRAIEGNDFMTFVDEVLRSLIHRIVVGEFDFGDTVAMKEFGIDFHDRLIEVLKVIVDDFRIRVDDDEGITLRSAKFGEGLVVDFVLFINEVLKNDRRHEKMGARLYDPSSGSIWTAEAEKVNESNVIGKGFRKNLSTYFTITGIVDTAFQYDRYSPLIDRTDLRSLETECRLSFSSGFTGMAFCSRETMINSINNNQKLPDMVLSHFDGSREDAKRIVEYADDVNFNASNVNKDMGLTFQSPGFSDPFSYSETILNFAKPSLYFGIGFGVFSILLSFTFFGSIAGEKKHEYGILSSLGVTNKGLSSLTSLSGLIVYVPSLVLGFAFSSIAIYGINLAVSNHIGVSMSLLNVNVGGVLILVLSFIVIGLMSILPALITCKRSIPAKLLLRG